MPPEAPTERRLAWTPRFPGGVRWTLASVQTLNLRTIPLDDRGRQVVNETLARWYEWVVFEGSHLVTRGLIRTREEAELAAELAADVLLGPHPAELDSPPDGWTRDVGPPPFWVRIIPSSGLLLMVRLTLEHGAPFRWTVNAGLETFDDGTAPSALEAAHAAETSARTY